MSMDDIIETDGKLHGISTTFNGIAFRSGASKPYIMFESGSIAAFCATEAEARLLDKQLRIHREETAPLFGRRSSR